MNRTEARRVMRTAFKALGKRQFGNLMHHVEKGTPICCGSDRGEWYRPSDGAG